MVIPTRDRLSFLREAVASALGQEAVEVEVIVVEDGGEDATSSWLVEHSDPRVHALEPIGHHGAAVQRNRGLAAATADLVLFLDDDDRLLPGGLRCLVGALRDEPAAVAAVGAFACSGTRYTHPARRVVRRPLRELLGGWGGVPGRVLVRADSVRRVGAWRPRGDGTEDRDMLLRLVAAGAFVLTPEVVLDYRIHSGQSKPTDIERRRLLLFDEHVADAQGMSARAAARARDAGRHWRAGQSALERGDGRAALAAFARTVVISPRLAHSPLVWPALAHGARDAARLMRRRGP